MRRENVIKSFKYGLFFSVLIMVMTFFVRKVFLDELGSELTGFYLLINQLLGFINLAELGLGTASTYLLFKPLHKKDNTELSIIISTIRDLYKKIQLLVLIIGFAIAFFLPFIVKDKLQYLELYIPWVLFVLATTLSYSYSSESILLSADQKLHYVRVINGLGRVISFSLQILSLKLGYGIIVFSIIELTSNILQLLLFKNIVKKQYHLKSIKNKEETTIFRKEIFTELKKTFIHKISGVLIFNTDYLLVSFFLGLAYVTSYSSYIMIIQALSFLITTVSAPLSAALGNYLHDKGGEATYKKFLQVNVFFFLCASVVSIVFYFVVNDVITLWLGKSVLLANESVLLISVNCFFLISRSAVDIFKVSYGYMSDIHLPLIEGVANLIISLILIKYMGINGVIIGTIFSNVVIIMIVRPYYLYKYGFKLDLNTFLKDYFLSWVPAIIAVFFCFIFVSYAKTYPIEVEGVMSLLFKCCVFTVIIGVPCTILFAVLSPDLRGLIKSQLRARYGR